MTINVPIQNNINVNKADVKLKEKIGVSLEMNSSLVSGSVKRVTLVLNSMLKRPISCPKIRIFSTTKALLN